MSCGTLVMLFLLVWAVADARGDEYLSPENLVPTRDGKLLYVTEVTAKRVATVDLATGKVMANCSSRWSPRESHCHRTGSSCT